jgi:hypothetical protein
MKILTDDPDWKRDLYEARALAIKLVGRQAGMTSWKWGAQFSAALMNQPIPPSHFEKIQWFARYWNSARPSIQGIPHIQGSGLSTYLAIE